MLRAVKTSLLLRLAVCYAHCTVHVPARHHSADCHRQLSRECLGLIFATEQYISVYKSETHQILLSELILFIPGRHHLRSAVYGDLYIPSTSTI